MIKALPAVVSICLTCWACNGDRDLPAAYRRIVIPSALGSEDALRRGERLYQTNCALCHGLRLDGRGVRQTGFTQPPRNFTDETWQRATSPRRIFFSIREGVSGTAMPAWRIFDVGETWDLVAYVRAASSTRRDLDRALSLRERHQEHHEIARSKTRSVSVSTSKLSSPSRAITVTVAPSGSSPSSSTRPPTTLPDAMCMKTF